MISAPFAAATVAILAAGAPLPEAVPAAEVPLPEAISAAGAPVPEDIGRCAVAGGTAAPERVALRPTSHARAASGWMELVMPPSPFGVTVAGDGRTVYDVTLAATSFRRRDGRHYVAWAATPDLDRVLRLGALDREGRATGRVAWNKFLVLVTEEAAPDGDRWAGPVLLTGLSPSGLLHTMRGHGIFEAHGVGC